MATAATIKKNIAKLEAALKSKATPKSLKSKLETQLVKSKAELSGINKGAKPKTSTSKSAQTALQKLKEMVNKNKKLKTYKKSGVDLEKDADRPALPIGRRTAKQSGKTYYEYRANRIDVKQPPKRYPKLEKGGYMAKGGKTKKGDVGKSGTQYGYTLKEYEEMAEKNGLFVSPKEWWSSREGKKYTDNLGRTKTIGSNSQDERQEMQSYGYRIAIGMDLGSDKIPASARKYVIENNLTKEEQKIEKGAYMAKGGKTKVDRERMYNFLKDDLAALEKAIEANNQEEINDIFLYWNRHIKDLEPETGSKRMYEFLKDDLVGLEAATKELPSSKEETDRFFSYWNIHLSSLEPKMEKGGYYDKGGFVAVGEKDGYWTIMSKPTTKEKAQEVIEMGVPRGEVGKVVTLEEAKAHKNTIGKEYLEKGGYFAKGGAMEHGLMVGDTVRDVAENSVAIYNVNNRKSFVVDLDKGTRTEWIGSFKDRKKYAEKGAYMAMGGEMHRTQE